MQGNRWESWFGSADGVQAFWLVAIMVAISPVLLLVWILDKIVNMDGPYIGGD